MQISIRISHESLLQTRIGSCSRIEHTGPVTTFPDLVDHVPTSWGSIWAFAVLMRYAPARSKDCKAEGAIVLCCSESARILEVGRGGWKIIREASPRKTRVQYYVHKPHLDATSKCHERQM